MKYVEPQDIARMAGNIASGICSNLSPDEVERQEARIAHVSVSLAGEIAVSIEALLTGDDDVKEASAAIGEALNGGDE